jgi:hypothetical protein
LGSGFVRFEAEFLKSRDAVVRESEHFATSRQKNGKVLGYFAFRG